jgi:hypothetical protein
MTLPPLRADLVQADSLLDLVRRLGSFCLAHESDLRELMADEDVTPLRAPIEARVQALALERQQIGSAGMFAELEHVANIEELVERAMAHHPIEYLAVLRGLCRGPLTRFYETTDSEIVLDRGSPVLLASRPIHQLFGRGRTSPRPSTLLGGHILDGLRYTIFRHSRGEGGAEVTLDFSHRERIDAIAWKDGRLPRIATIHPNMSGSAIEITEENHQWFFGVRPKRWDVEVVLAQLGLAHESEQAEIAVLPELCLPLADALEDALAADPGRYPSLVVAGSAHVRESPGAAGKEVRANESRIYLDGERVATHRKIHPFRTKLIGGRILERRISEGLTSERKQITVLAGEHTRLAVVICADLNDDTIPLLLQGAAVNFLLVPALTGGSGAFNAAIAGLACHHQAVVVIVNPTLERDSTKAGVPAPFRVLAGVPRPEPADQVGSFPLVDEQPTEIGVIDPNAVLPRAMRWLSSAAVGRADFRRLP